MLNFYTLNGDVLLRVARDVLFFSGSFSPLTNKITPFFRDLKTFLQSAAVLVAAGMAIFYKLREIVANPQEDQMFSQKTKSVLVAIGFIFIVPTIITVVSSYFK